MRINKKFFVLLDKCYLMSILTLQILQVVKFQTNKLNLVVKFMQLKSSNSNHYFLYVSIFKSFYEVSLQVYKNILVQSEFKCIKLITL